MTPTPEIYTLPQHGALPIFVAGGGGGVGGGRGGGREGGREEIEGEMCE